MTLKLDFSVLLRDEYPQWIFKGVVTMFELTALAWLLAIAVGTILAVIRMSNSRVGQGLVAAYVEYHQNVPMLVQIFIWYFGIPALLPQGLQQWFNAHNSEFLFAFIAVGLCMGAYMSEDLRGGIRSIPKSQLEASRALDAETYDVLRDRLKTDDNDYIKERARFVLWRRSLRATRAALARSRGRTSHFARA